MLVLMTLLALLLICRLCGARMLLLLLVLMLICSLCGVCVLLLGTVTVWGGAVLWLRLCILDGYILLLLVLVVLMALLLI